MGGIFFDEGWPECGPNNIYSDLYAYINNYTKRKHPGAFTVLNPGSTIAQCFENTMDTLLTFESSFETYQSSYQANDWTPTDPRKIWHIVYRVPQDQVATIAALACKRFFIVPHPRVPSYKLKFHRFLDDSALNILSNKC